MKDLSELNFIRENVPTVSAKGNNIFFNENLTLAEIDKLEKAPKENASQLSPVYFVHSPPPGLTPTRYPQKSYTYTEPGSTSTNTTATTNDMASSSPTPFKTDNVQQNMVQPVQFMYSSSPERQLQSPYHQHQQMMYGSPTNNNSLYMKRTGGNKMLSLSASSDEFTFGQQDQQNLFNMQAKLSSQEKKKPLILEESKDRYTGRLKFFDENKNYGFIIMDEDGSDIFVHYDDLVRAGVGKELLKTARLGNVIKLAFSCMKYVGKYDRSRKATDILLLS